MHSGKINTMELTSSKEVTMKCPLFRAANIIEEFDPNWSGDDCLKEECGWWDKDRKQCSELSK